ncbi:MAG: GNAT family N-acetyltransferase, partial [Bacteroidota bacterium]
AEPEVAELADPPEELRREGFVTVVHNFDLLKNMNLAAPSVIAKDGDRVVGYNIVMLRDFSDRIPVLFSLFEQLETVDFKGKPLAAYDYVCCGQVCVAEGYRGQNVFDRLCEKYREAYAGRFELMLTDISSRNPRSLRAHRRVGFDVVKTFQAEDGEVWDIVVWDWR